MAVPPWLQHAEAAATSLRAEGSSKEMDVESENEEPVEGEFDEQDLADADVENVDLSMLDLLVEANLGEPAEALLSRHRQLCLLLFLQHLQHQSMWRRLCLGYLLLHLFLVKNGLAKLLWRLALFLADEGPLRLCATIPGMVLGGVCCPGLLAPKGSWEACAVEAVS